MKTKTWVASLGAVLMLTTATYFVLAHEKARDGKPETAVSSAKPLPEPPVDQAPIEPASHCNNCVSSFCSRYGVRCTWTGECCSGQGAAHKNCEYTCACDATCTTVTSPSNVCITQPGPDCCVLCQVEWCKFQDFKCTATCTGGCCTYSDCVEAACNAEPCPANACPGTCN